MCLSRLWESLHIFEHWAQRNCVVDSFSVLTNVPNPMFDFIFCTTLGEVGESFVWWIFLCLVNFFWVWNGFPHSGQAFVAFGSFSFAVCALAVCLFRLCLNLVSYGHSVQVRMDRDFSFLMCCLIWFLCWSFPTRKAWHSVHVKCLVSCALAWWAMRSTSFAKTFAHSVQRRSISLKSFEYTDQIWSNSQVLKTLTMKRDEDK